MPPERPTREDRINEKQGDLLEEPRNNEISDARFDRRMEATHKKLDRIKDNENIDRVMDFFNDYPELNQLKLKRMIKDQPDLSILGSVMVDHPRLTDEGVQKMKRFMQRGNVDDAMYRMVWNVNRIAEWKSKYPKHLTEIAKMEDNAANLSMDVQPYPDSRW